jgi:hypothetical protein
MLAGYAIVFKAPTGWAWRHPDRTLQGSFATPQEASLDARKHAPLLAVTVVKDKESFSCKRASRPNSRRQMFNRTVREKTSLRLSF